MKDEVLALMSRFETTISTFNNNYLPKPESLKLLIDKMKALFFTFPSQE
jgi:hypothetical protein